MSRIDTQDLILGGRPNVHRITEIGPSKVLATMAGKTLNRKFLSQDRARVVKRQLLSNSTDTKAICYEYDEDNVAMEETSAPVPTESTNQIIEEEYDDYRQRAQERERRINRVFIEASSVISWSKQRIAPHSRL